MKSWPSLKKERLVSNKLNKARRRSEERLSFRIRYLHTKCAPLRLCPRLFLKLIIICIAWIDGFAIMVAVLVVSGVGSIVDYRKEVEFVLRRNNADKSKLVSDIFIS